MNLQTVIKPELWKAISDTYNAENYTSAILNAIHYLSDVLRNKADVDGDGTKLVGEAFNGDSPKLRLNKLETETEKGVQKGVAQLLVGLYISIRNPRSHEMTSDTKVTADAIIHFINYLVEIIDASQEIFSIESFLDRVFDPDFVKNNDRYAELLVEKVPAKKRLDTMIHLFRGKRGDGLVLQSIFRAFFKKLTESQLSEFLHVVSDELAITNNDSTIRYCFQILLPEYWEKLDEISRLRVENKIRNYIQQGEVNLIDEEVNNRGALATWAREFLIYFLNKDSITSTFIAKFQGDESDRAYVSIYFMEKIPELVTTGSYTEIFIIDAICHAIIKNDYYVKKYFKESIYLFPTEWKKNFEKNLEGVTTENGEPFYNMSDIDDIPF